WTIEELRDRVARTRRRRCRRVGQKRDNRHLSRNPSRQFQSLYRLATVRETNRQADRGALDILSGRDSKVGNRDVEGSLWPHKRRPACRAPVRWEKKAALAFFPPRPSEGHGKPFLRPRQPLPVPDRWEPPSVLWPSGPASWPRTCKPPFIKKQKGRLAASLDPSGCMEWILQKAFEAVVFTIIIPAFGMADVHVGPRTQVGKPFLDGLDQDGLDQLRHPFQPVERRLENEGVMNR